MTVAFYRCQTCGFTTAIRNYPGAPPWPVTMVFTCEHCEAKMVFIFDLGLGPSLLSGLLP